MRWPNDVVVGGRKLAGVLAELREGQIVVGVGVNANHTAGQLPPGARVRATSLRILRGAPVDRAQLLADLSRRSRAATPGSSGRGSPASSGTSCAAAGCELAGGARAPATGVDEPAGWSSTDGRTHSAEVTAVLVGEDGGDYTAVDTEAECQDGS